MTICDAGSLTQASVILEISQPALSRHIKDLEKRLSNTRLLKRTGRGMTPTNAGLRLYEFAKQTVESYEDAYPEIIQLGSELPPELTIAVPIRTGRLLIPALHKAFKRELPNLSLHIDEEYSRRAVKLLLARKCDIAIAYSPPITSSTSQELLFEESLFLVGPESLIGKNNQNILIEDIENLPLLLTSESTPLRKLVNTAFTHKKLNPIIRHELETSEALLVFAKEGEGAAILPYSNIYREHPAGEIAARKIINPEIKRQISLSVGAHTDHRLSLLASKIIRGVLSELEETLLWTALSYIRFTASNNPPLA